MMDEEEQKPLTHTNITREPTNPAPTRSIVGVFACIIFSIAHTLVLIFATRRFVRIWGFKEPNAVVALVSISVVAHLAFFACMRLRGRRRAFAVAVAVLLACEFASFLTNMHPSHPPPCPHDLHLDTYLLTTQRNTHRRCSSSCVLEAGGFTNVTVWVGRTASEGVDAGSALVLNYLDVMRQAATDSQWVLTVEDDVVLFVGEEDVRGALCATDPDVDVVWMDARNLSDNFFLGRFGGGTVLTAFRTTSIHKIVRLYESRWSTKSGVSIDVPLMAFCHEGSLRCDFSLMARESGVASTLMPGVVNEIFV